MIWNWQQNDWPNFVWDESSLEEFEKLFLREAGMLVGALRHMSEDEKEFLTVELISTEAVKTSEIEGDILDRASVQSSIKRNFGLDSDNLRIPPAEQGIHDQ